MAVIEAKRESKNPEAGLQKAIRYAGKLNVRFVFATNGRKIYEFDLLTGKGNYISRMPTLDELLLKSAGEHIPLKEILLAAGPGPIVDRSLRPYQETATNKILESIALRDSKVLVEMPVGTGKSSVLLQVVHRLKQSSWNIQGAAREPKVLFLTDRTILMQQVKGFFPSR